MKKILILPFFLALFALANAEIKVGTGRKIITPQTPIWLSGYASRKQPATEILHDLWAKAVVIEQNNKNRIIIVTTDLLGLPHEVSEEVSQRVIKKYGIKRSQLLLSSSHTHSGPVIRPGLSVMYELNDAETQAVKNYTLQLIDDIVNVVDMAMNRLTPMILSAGHGSVDFAVNRREPTEEGVIIGVNPDGPVDHDVPVLKITSPDGKLQAVLFAYACHNTTSNTYLINGDYAGFAQIELEKAYPGATAMFLMGCGADQNPYPRGSTELAASHGKSLADAVKQVLESELTAVRPPISTEMSVVTLEFPPFDPDVYSKELTDPDRYKQRRAKLVLENYSNNLDVNKMKYPVQAIRFGNDLTIIALSGEVVVDYSLEIKKKYPGENLFISGYCNEVQCYIPSLRVLTEGGYEPETSMIYYGLPGPFTSDVQKTVFTGIDKVMKSTGAGKSKN